MSSSVVYKFKASNQQHSIHFDGPHIPVHDVRAQIIRDGRIDIGHASFDLELSNAQTGDVYGERALIARNTAVLVRRVPMHRRAPIESQHSSMTGIGLSPRLQSTENSPVLQKSVTHVGDVGEAGPSDTALAVVNHVAVDAPDAPRESSAAVSAGSSLIHPRSAPAPKGGGKYAAKLMCPLSRGLFVEAVIVTCCGTSFSKVARCNRVHGGGGGSNDCASNFLLCYFLFFCTLNCFPGPACPVLGCAECLPKLRYLKVHSRAYCTITRLQSMTWTPS